MCLQLHIFIIYLNSVYNPKKDALLSWQDMK